MEFIVKADLMEELEKKSYSYGSKRFIREFPTVKAIPIEWLREYCKYNHTPDGMDWHIAIELIIKRWEKENDNN